ncbi:GDP-mannose 4,6-dehydratase [Candidatus Woesearchaeota archaeon]|nr:GDP-mannose 4,6-dehydratase [Candidatus Woesearchaeota archaeon]
MSAILVTGAAGFVGSRASKELVRQGHSVVGVDNFNDYYNPEFKEQNIKDVKVRLYREDIRNFAGLQKIFSENKIDKIVHLAAMVGVRPSIQNPFIYEEVNVRGTLNLLELARHNKIKKFVFASSSSVYGNRDKVPFSEDDITNSPISPYAATKKAGELLCCTYSSLYRIPSVCLRLFTVYGPCGRSDMAPYKFVDSIANGRQIEMYGDGSTRRDYTFIADVVSGIMKSMDLDAQYEIINLGCGNPVELREFIGIIEKNLGKKAKIVKEKMQPGDVKQTYADISKAKKLLGYSPKTKVEEGLRILCEWYMENRFKR